MEPNNNYEQEIDFEGFDVLLLCANGVEIDK